MQVVIVIKRYRQNNSVVEYWRIWESGRYWIIHIVVVGQNGCIERVEKSGELGPEFVSNQAKEIEAKGFSASPQNGYFDAEIEISVPAGQWVENVAVRHKLEERFDEELGATGNGECEGGDIGESVMSVYCRVIDRGSALRIFERILAEYGAANAKISFFPITQEE